MLKADQVEELISVVAAMDRTTVARHLREFRGSFPVDFTPSFLDTVSLDRLRHIFVAVCLQNKRMPDFAGSRAA